MEKNLRLRSNQDFKKVYARGKSYRNRNFILIVRPNTLSRPRVGFSITKNRKQRNKKSFKEAIAGNCPTKPKSAEKTVGHDCDSKKNTLDLSYQQLESSLLHVLRLSMQGKKKPK